jgi:hypothetical protein
VGYITAETGRGGVDLCSTIARECFQDVSILTKFNLVEPALTGRKEAMNPQVQ